MLIAEELLLIAIDPRSGRIPIGSREYLTVGLAGALLAELALDHHLDRRDRDVRPSITSGAAPADPLLAQILSGLTDRGPQRPTTALKDVAGGVWDQLVDRLVAADVLGRERTSALTTTRHRVLDLAVHAAILTAARHAAATDEPLEPREAVVLALVGPCRLLERVAPNRSDRRHARARIAEATELAPFGPAVEKVIDDLIATIAAISTITVATATG